uniref:A-kinase anchoring protein 8 like n=1 Tax=Sphenodon punctatus TaxID=8508 RepID=A0A8D0G2B6_SPHPU
MVTSNSWEMASSETDMNPNAPTGTTADVAKFNHMETMQGGYYGSGGDRYDSYESYDSRSSLNDRDLYRSGYEYSEAEQDADGVYEGCYGSSYGNHRDQYQYQNQNRARDNFGQRGQNWARDGRNNRPMAAPSYSGRLGGQWSEPPMGGRGHGPNRPPSLFSHNLFPELSMFQGMRSFSGNMRFGGGGMKQRMRRNWKMWDAEFKKKKFKKDPAPSKRKQANSSDEPDSKAAKTDGSESSDSENEPGTEGEAAEKGGKAVSNVPEGGSREERALTIQEEISQIKRKLQAGKKTQERQKKRFRDRMVERIQFVCSLCKYRTFYEDEMNDHLESKFHKEHFKFVGTKLPQQTADFLQEYVAHKTKKTEERRQSIEDINAVIQQVYRDQDLTQDISMEHFVKKVEAAHCAACDLFIPMQYGILQRHLKSLDHNHNRRAMMEQSKKSSLVVAKSILNNKLISKKLERYLKVKQKIKCVKCFGVMPSREIQRFLSSSGLTRLLTKEHEEGEAGTSGTAEEGTAEGEEENKDEGEEEVAAAAAATKEEILEEAKQAPEEDNPDAGAEQEGAEEEASEPEKQNSQAATENTVQDQPPWGEGAAEREGGEGGAGQPPAE